jgi:Domain of unknown function (DUF1992)
MWIFLYLKFDLEMKECMGKCLYRGIFPIMRFLLEEVNNTRKTYNEGRTIPMDLFSIIAEDKIKKAIEEGEFDNLPGQGKPLNLEDLSHIPEELRIAYKVLKNSKMLNDVETLKKEVSSIEDLIVACEDLQEKEVLKQKKQERLLRIENLMKKRKGFNSPASSFYKDKVLNRFKK